MASPDEFNLNEAPAQVSKVADIEMPVIEFDAPMEIKKVNNPKGGVVEITLQLLEHEGDDKPSVFGDETGLNSVGGKLMYAFKHGHTLAISGISIQPDKEESNESD
ncbi:hypothetical protein QUF74_05470 [Candidatus Halobeggiatoa sp. HSG11]|nr:hypothetical protein [Candidatus Halobeggiatoa sp. HSG11]